MQVFQENLGSRTVTKTKSKYKEKGHGCLWWILIGSWWWIFDMLLWIFAFIPRLLLRIGRRKRYTGRSTSRTVTSNKVEYATILVCKSCGHRWEK